MNVGERIRAARKQAGMTQKDLTEKTGICRSGICLYESGKRTIDINSLRKIASALNVPIESLMSDQTRDAYETDSLKLEEARMELEAQFNKDMDDLRKIQKERDKLMLEADKAAMEAIRTALGMMNDLQGEEKNKSVAAMGAADLGRAIATLRESMNQKHYPTGHGWMA